MADGCGGLGRRPDARCRGEQWHGEHRGDDDEILQEEHGDGESTVRGGGLAAVGEELEHNRRARHRHQYAGEYRLRQRAEIPPRGHRYQRRGADDLRQAHPGHRRQHDDQPRERELKSHREQQHDDADLGERLDDVQVGDER